MSDIDIILEELAGFSSDPLGFVLFAFPWGESGGELEAWDGPEPWQVEILTQLGQGVITISEAIQLARTSGHGIGKSACVSWIILWAISTFEDTKGVVTANTENQLKTKTWAELAKWFRLFIGKALFQMTATAIFSRDPEHEKTWRIDMVPWSERNTEAFAGLHNQGKRILVVFDEASAIPDVIWEVTEGALTDRNTQIIWIVFGNPTKNSGRFRDCFEGGKFSHRWKNGKIDSRAVSLSDKAQIKRWAEDYGEDSDFFRVRVRGEFPRVDAVSFISFELARAATVREILPQEGPVVLGVDVARFGDDASVIYPRCGLDGRSRPIEVYRGLDTMSFADKIVQAAHRYGSSNIFVDEGGVGGGVVDRLRQLALPVIGVDFGAKADYSFYGDQGTKYSNKRSEIWGAVREWLKTGFIPAEVLDISLLDELTAPTYGFNVRDEIQLERKTDMRRRGVASPNIADALACTFGHQVWQPSYHMLPQASLVEADYNPYEMERIYG